MVFNAQSGEARNGPAELSLHEHEFLPQASSPVTVSPQHKRLRMGIYYRESASLGLFRVNPRKSGVG
jgi:hypothetical protein